MKITKFIIIISLGLILGACGRSKQPQFYMLNPLPPASPSARYVHLKIGIDAIRTPAFTEKPQIMIYDGFNRVQLEEFHQWAESLDRNIRRVIKTNLNMLLPGAIIKESPWDIDFKPTHSLEVIISEFKIDMLGNSSLRAEYIITYHNHIVKKYSKYYYLKLPAVTVETLVRSMNSNLNHLSEDIAKSFGSQKIIRVKSRKVRTKVCVKHKH